MNADPKNLPDPIDAATIAAALEGVYQTLSGLDGKIHEIQSALKEQMYALRIAQDPEVSASVEAAALEIAAGRAREGAATADEVTALRARRSS